MDFKFQLIYIDQRLISYFVIFALVDLTIIQAAFVSKGIIEIVPKGSKPNPEISPGPDVPSSNGLSIPNVGKVAKVSKLFSVKRKKLPHLPSTEFDKKSSQVTSPSPPTDKALTEEHNQTEAYSEKSESLDWIPVQRRRGTPTYYNHTSNALVSAESWDDLSTLLTADEMNGFLKSLPISTLRELTSLSRKNPELGQKQLVRMILDKSEHFKKNQENDAMLNVLPKRTLLKEKMEMANIQKISGHKVNPYSEKSIFLKGKKIGINDPDLDESVSNILNKVTNATTTELPVLMIPTTEPQTSTPALDEFVNATDETQESVRNERVFPMHLKDIPNYNNGVGVNSSSRQLNSFNSGYYIPPLTTSSPINEVKPLDSHNQFSWSLQPQDPENTYQPHTDRFLKPPGVPNRSKKGQGHGDKDQSSEILLTSSREELNGTGSEGWGNYSHPFSGFNLSYKEKLQPSASNEDHNEENPYNNHKNYYNEYHPSVSEDDHPRRKPSKTRFKYTHSTIQQGPVNSFSTGPFPLGQQNENELEGSNGNPIIIDGNSNDLEWSQVQNPTSGQKQPNRNQFISRQVSSQQPDQFRQQASPQQPPVPFPGQVPSQQLQQGPFPGQISPQQQQGLFPLQVSLQQQQQQGIVPGEIGPQRFQDFFSGQVSPQPEQLGPQGFFSDQGFPQQQSEFIVGQRQQFGSGPGSFQQQQISGPGSPYLQNGNYNGNGGDNWSKAGVTFMEGLWTRSKAFFTKGGKSTAEKVFEISIGVLSFLAFGGYLMILIYQVFVVSSNISLFPLFTSNLSTRPTLIGAILGRSSGDGDSYSSILSSGIKFEEKYINELESIVKQAMARVKSLLEAPGDKVQSKGELGH